MNTRSYNGTSAFKLLNVAQPDSPTLQKTQMTIFSNVFNLFLSYDCLQPAIQLITSNKLKLLLTRNAVIVTVHLRTRAIPEIKNSFLIRPHFQTIHLTLTLKMLNGFFGFSNWQYRLTTRAILIRKLAEDCNGCEYK
ncbi:hypothetical protein BJL95_16735 [Methylomonas sp. LWB]|nr:hypothetical protein BJL95_17640 [Methylomonas sp. LWB]OHX34733.1 hypothetical protein BJL95_21935 [Methylomonas sp. LWB]OHX35029.1 hypothetical protein BJL95_00285 [Methylomonas sp. LWB]OHX36444.1 hypothetical protein BJL95_16735 [Methylomonas sp. LWB]